MSFSTITSIVENCEICWIFSKVDWKQVNFYRLSSDNERLQCLLSSKNEFIQKFSNFFSLVVINVQSFYAAIEMTDCILELVLASKIIKIYS